MKETSAQMAVLEKHRIWGYSGKGIAGELDAALARKCPEDISSVRQSMEHIVERLKRMEEKANESAQREAVPAAGTPGGSLGEPGDADNSGMVE